MRHIPTLLVAVLAVGLAGCVDSPSPAPSPTATADAPSVTPSPTPTAESDLLLTLTARVTAEAGSADVRLEVYRPLAPTDPEVAGWRADLITACREEFAHHGEGDATVPFTAPGAAIVRTAITVAPTPSATWAADGVIALHSLGYVVPNPNALVSSGPGHSVFRCSAGNVLVGTGSANRGLLSNSDIVSDSVDDAFAASTYGVWVREAPLEGEWNFAIGTVTDCAYALTDLGRQLIEASPLAADWGETITMSNCEVGRRF